MEKETARNVTDAEHSPTGRVQVGTDCSNLDGKGAGVATDYIVKHGGTFWRVCFDANGNYEHLLSCTHGYDHNVTFDEVQKMEVVGSLQDFKHLLECD